jgi:sortase (surface protein transpeptidase)
VPAIGVDAAMELVGRDAGGRMAVPSRPEDVGWYGDGAAPGDPGDAVIDGHLDWGNRPAVFWRLRELGPGDEIAVDMPGRGTARFQVETLTTVPYTARPPGLFATSGPSRLSLVTCVGPFDYLARTYSQRLIVDARPVP